MNDILISRVTLTSDRRVPIERQDVVGRLTVSARGVVISSLDASVDRAEIERAITDVLRKGVWGFASGPDTDHPATTSYYGRPLTPSDQEWFADEFARSMGRRLGSRSGQPGSTVLIAHLQPGTATPYSGEVLGMALVGLSLACSIIAVMRTWVGVFLGLAIGILFLGLWHLTQALSRSTVLFERFVHRALPWLVLVPFVVGGVLLLLPATSSRIDAHIAAMHPSDSLWRFAIADLVSGVAAYGAGRWRQRGLRALLAAIASFVSFIASVILLLDAILRNL
jgi:hypothetical protein